LDNDRNPMVRKLVMGLFNGLFQKRPRVQRLGPHSNSIRLNLCHLHRLSYQGIKAGALLVNDGCELDGRFAVQAMAIDKSGCGRSDGSERSAQFMGERVDQRSPQPVCRACGLKSR
jgi:hypothetical protein